MEIKQLNGKQAKNFLKQLENHLVQRYKKTGKPNFSDTLMVSVHHEDGSLLNFDYALVVNHRGWWFIISEHNGSYFNHEEDIDVVVYKRYYKESSVLVEYLKGV